MISNIDHIREVASRDQYITEIKVFTDSLMAQDKAKALFLIKTLFFAPETHPKVRYVIAERMGKVGQKQMFQQLLSYFILRKFPDTVSLIAALKSFGDPEAAPALMAYYPEASFRECLEIIDALSTSQSPDSLEFLSQIYNEQMEYQQSFDRQEMEEIRQQATLAMGKGIMRFDFF